jgi:hypothetical protein
MTARRGSAAAPAIGFAPWPQTGAATLQTAESLAANAICVDATNVASALDTRKFLIRVTSRNIAVTSAYGESSATCHFIPLWRFAPPFAAETGVLVRNTRFPQLPYIPDTQEQTPLTEVDSGSRG